MNQISRFGQKEEGREVTSGSRGGRREGQEAVGGVGHAVVEDLAGGPGGERGWA